MKQEIIKNKIKHLLWSSLFEYPIPLESGAPPRQTWRGSCSYSYEVPSKEGTRLPTKKGFTLIELIVVIAIISLLSSIVLAALADSKDKAINVGIIQQVREYETAIGLYIINNQNRYPNVGDTDMHCIGSGSTPCLWVGVEIPIEASGPLVSGLGDHITGLPFVNTPTLTAVATYKGLLYQCNDAQCRSANFYWPEFNTTSCTHGDIFWPGSNGVLCTQLAEGVRD